MAHARAFARAPAWALARALAWALEMAFAITLATATTVQLLFKKHLSSISTTKGGYCCTQIAFLFISNAFIKKFPKFLL